MFGSSVRVGQMDMGDVPRVWRKVEGVERLAQNAGTISRPGVLTPHLFDTARPGGHRLYPAVERSLTAARDSTDALCALLEHHGATGTAMWSLLRTQFESAFWAYWLLEPQDSRDRVLRGVQREWLDDRKSRTYFEELAKDPAMPLSEQEREELATGDLGHDATFAAEAAANGAERWSKPPNVDVTRELSVVTIEGSPALRTMLRVSWRDLAGAQHGSVGAILRLSDKEQIAASVGGVTVRLSPSDSAFQQHASTAALLHAMALTRYMWCFQPVGDPRAVDLKELQRGRAFFGSL